MHASGFYEPEAGEVRKEIGIHRGSQGNEREGKAQEKQQEEQEEEEEMVAVVVEESPEREHTHYLNARHSVRSMQPPHLYARAPGFPFLTLPVYLLQPSSPLSSSSPSADLPSPSGLPPSPVR